MKMMMKVTVLYNLPDKDNLEIAESDEDTRKSAEEVCENIKVAGYGADLLGINYDEIEKIKLIKSDIVFNLVEWSGKHTEDGVKVIETLQAAMVPFTGSDGLGYRLSSDKLIMKKAFYQFGIPTPKWMMFETDFKGVIPQFRYPVIVKPALEHCGIGVTQKSLAQNEIELRTKALDCALKYQSSVLIEEYIGGRELHVTVLEKDGKPWVLPPGEVVFEKREGFWPILTYDAKWKEDGPEYELSEMVLAEMTDKLRRTVKKIASDTYIGLGGRDYPRLDMRVRGSEVFVLEINNNPGIDFDIQSGIGVSARAVGFDYPRLLKHIVDNAVKRFKHT